MKSNGLRWTREQYESYLKRNGIKESGSLYPIKDDPNYKKCLVVEKEVKSKEPNKTEQSFALILRAKFPKADIRYEEYTLRLSDRMRYTPDFAVIDDGCIDFYEVKGGFIFSKAMNKPKAAASQYPHHRFFLAQKKEGSFTITQIKSNFKI